MAKITNPNVLNPQKVFVYGTFMDGCHNNHVLKNAGFFGVAQTVVPKWLMALTESYPIAVEYYAVNPEKYFNILGELYVVESSELTALDAAAGGLFTRAETIIVDEDNDCHLAWIYRCKAYEVESVSVERKVKPSAWKKPQDNLLIWNPTQDMKAA